MPFALVIILCYITTRTGTMGTADVTERTPDATFDHFVFPPPGHQVWGSPTCASSFGMCAKSEVAVDGL